MPDTKCFAQVRGSVIRATRVSACGEPVIGATSTSVSKRISSVTFEEITEEGTNIRDRNFGDEIMVVDESFTATLGYTVDIAFLGVDPGLLSLLSGQPVVLNAAGDVVGWDATTTVDLDSFGFALEIWSKIAGQACDPSGNRVYGYTLAPFLKGGRIGGFSFENATVSFTLTGAKTIDGNGWGVGPYDVDRDVANAPAPLHTAIGENTAYRNILVSLEPPVAQCGTFALAP